MSRPSADVPADHLAARYGRSPRGGRPWYRRPLPLLGAVVAALLVLAYGAWIAVEQTQGPTATEIGHRILDDSTAELRLEINHEPGVAARCTVAALSETSAEVGLLDVDVAADEPAAVQRTVTVRTTARAVTVRVGSCSEVRAS
ncbi:DUF4307 domain-containing protein [Kineococcus gynurae]|uniref:DUF4307 domain-containing protein n=1 Tax=Kineococcus gynurae TaxID=452979 RepID=A0ABV5LNI8_9ACTN